jgi:hypothetical protein
LWSFARLPAYSCRYIVLTEVEAFLSLHTCVKGSGSPCITRRPLWKRVAKPDAGSPALLVPAWGLPSSDGFFVPYAIIITPYVFRSSCFAWVVRSCRSIVLTGVETEARSTSASEARFPVCFTQCQVLACMARDGITGALVPARDVPVRRRDLVYSFCC